MSCTNAGRQYVFIHVGQAGASIGKSMWELLCHEHGVQPDGSVIPQTAESYLEVLFNDNSSTNLSPRAIFVDHCMHSINDVLTSTHADLYDVNSMICGFSDSSGNFGRGKFIEDDIYKRLYFQIRKHLEDCDHPTTAMVIRGSSGGCGGACGPEVLKHLYDKVKCCLNVEIAPSRGDSVISPYNYVLSHSNSMDFCDLNIPIQNERIGDILNRMCGTTVQNLSPKMSHYNQFIAATIANLTSDRFLDRTGLSISSMAANLVPFKDLQHITCAFTPVVRKDVIEYQRQNKSSVMRFTFDAFKAENNFLTYENAGNPMSCLLSYRGNIAISDVNLACQEYRKHFGMRWTGFKYGVISPPLNVPDHFSISSMPRSLVKAANHPGISVYFTKILSQYAAMYEKKYWLHNYMKAGMKMEDFQLAFDRFQELTDKYVELMKTVKL